MFVKNETPPKVTHEDLVKNRLAPLSDHLYPQPPKRQTSLKSLNRDVTDSLTRNRISVRERKTRSRSQMHCIHIINRFKIFHHFFATHPIICYDNKHCFPKVAWLRVVTLAVAAFIFNTTNLSLLACSLTLRKVFTCKPSGRHHVDDLCMGCGANVIAFMLMTSQVERRKLLICLFVVLLPATYCRFYRGVLPFW